MKWLVFVCSLSLLSLPLFAQPAPKLAQTVPPGTWPYTTYNALVSEGFAQPIRFCTAYGQKATIMQGATLTRFEFAVFTQRLEKKLQAHQHRGLKHRKTIQKQISALSKEFHAEMSDIEMRTRTKQYIQTTD